jgi:leader peptidase (prepilin peptidase) / N-methyltransferase
MISPLVGRLDPMTSELLPLAIVIGAVIGSFLNVVIVRLPENQSLITPRSRCPVCETGLHWFDNIPLLSFAALRGRCRACGVSIPWRYPIVEAVTAGLFALAALRATSLIDLVVAWIFLAALIAITGIDLGRQIIPDRITLPGIVVGFLTSFLGTRVSWLDSLVGLLVGGGILFAVIVLSGGGMGGGDMKLGALMGAFLGYKLVLLALFLAVVLGGGIALVLLSTGIRRRKDPIPFGPFLATGAAVAILFGEGIVAWYAKAFWF